MTEKDYSLLRPFDLEAAKGGVKMCDRFNLKKTHTYVAGPDSGGWIVTKNENGIFIFSTETNLFMLPICWVEGKPVYPGDELERANGKAFIPDMVAISGELRMCGEGLPSFLKPELLRWPRPKPVKRWINVYPGMYRGGGPCSTTVHSTEEAAKFDISNGGSIACVEIELPPLPTK